MSAKQRLYYNTKPEYSNQRQCFSIDYNKNEKKSDVRD